MTNDWQPRAVIVGGSMAGLFAGHFLRLAGWRVDIFERTPGPLNERGAGIMTHPEMLTALSAIGLETAADFGVSIDMRVTLDGADRIVATRACHQVATAWTRVHTLLADGFPAQHYHSGREFMGLQQVADKVTARFADGSLETADLLIGADGFRSSVRGCLYANLTPDYAGYVAWRGLLAEADIDTPPFARASRFAFNLPPGEQMIGYPVAGPSNDLRPGKRNYNFVWYRPADELSQLPQLLTDHEGLLHALSIPPTRIAPAVIAEMRAHASRTLAPWFQAVVAKTAQPFLQPIYDLAVPAMASGRVALIGDAAFIVRPHVGAGVLKAAQDAEALAAGLTAAGHDVVQALQRFSNVRHPIGTQMIAQARRLGSYLRYDYATDAERAAAAAMAAPEVVMAETAVLNFLRV